MKQWSGALGREMELLRFGDRGLPLVAFPTSMGRFYQWEDFGLVAALQDKIDAGYIQLWCVDSVDGESWYDQGKSSAERVRRATEYESYILHEVRPQAGGKPVLTGPSFGAFHAVLMALRQPDVYGGFVAMSGAFSTRHWLGDNFDMSVYFNDPLMFLPGLVDDRYLTAMRGWLKKVIVTGEDDSNAGESRQVAELIRGKGVDLTLDVWPGWAHDWEYWKEMMRRYV
jgi:esterase/lipase superfamily enzyme